MNLPKELKNRRGERLDFVVHPGERTDSLLLLGHGVTGDKDRPLLIAVAEGLAAKGWSCLRLSFSGNGDSEGCFKESTISKESEDLIDVLNQLPEGLQVGYCGHSMGGAVGLTTVEKDDRIKLLITLGGMVRTEEFCEREFRGEVPGEGVMWEDGAFPLSQAYVDDMARIGDLFPQVERLRLPYLLVHGAADDVVMPRDSVDAHQRADCPKRLVLVEGAEHSFDDSTYGIVVEALDDWLKSHFCEASGG